MRFFDLMLEVASELTRDGEIVLAPFVAIRPEEQPASRTKAELDDLHFDKIDMSDSIFVVNPGGYVGDSTLREIERAQVLGKAVRSLEPLELRPTTRGTCIHCGVPRKLRQDGTIPRHYPADGAIDFRFGERRCPDHTDCEHVVCPGSGQAPGMRAF
jgi:hypothetical protein